MAKEKKTSKKPPMYPIKSAQMDMFRDFVTNNKKEVSNTVQIWERIPKYFLTPQQIEKIRTTDGHATPYEWEYIEDGHKYTVVLQPAFIKEKGEYKAHFPSTTEELIEEILKKILTDQQCGIHDHQKPETWVRFTLGMLWRELKANGRTRDRQQIKQAVDIMSSCVITFKKDGKEIWKGAILQDLVTVGRNDYLADTDAHHIARLPLFISHAINKLEYRQFNYERLMNCNGQLTRWIYKKLINDYRHASLTKTYHFMYSSLKASGLLQQTREIDNRRKVVEALDELKTRGILNHYEIDQRKVGRKITDVKYTVTASIEFSSEQKASNLRAKNNQIKAEQIPITCG